MIEPNVYITLALASLAGLAMIVAGGLAGWRGWLSLRRMELDHMQDGRMPVAVSTGSRIEIADLKERIKKLEAIAAGVVVFEDTRSGFVPPVLKRYGRPATAHGMATLTDIREEYDFLEPDDRYRLLIDLGKELELMPEALKTDATLVRGCSASVWVYPTTTDDGRLHFLADSNAAITKGIIALVLLTVQDQAPGAIVATDIKAELAPFDLSKQLSSNRTQGIPNMIALIRETAERYA